MSVINERTGMRIQDLLLNGEYWNGEIRHFEGMCEISFESVEMPTEEGYDPIRNDRTVEYIDPSWFPVFARMGWVNTTPVDYTQEDYCPDIFGDEMCVEYERRMEDDIPF